MPPLTLRHCFAHKNYQFRPQQLTIDPTIELVCRHYLDNLIVCSQIDIHRQSFLPLRRLHSIYSSISKKSSETATERFIRVPMLQGIEASSHHTDYVFALNVYVLHWIGSQCGIYIVCVACCSRHLCGCALFRVVWLCIKESGIYFLHSLATIYSVCAIERRRTKQRKCGTYRHRRHSVRSVTPTYSVAHTDTHARHATERKLTQIYKTMCINCVSPSQIENYLCVCHIDDIWDTQKRDIHTNTHMRREMEWAISLTKYGENYKRHARAIRCELNIRLIWIRENRLHKRRNWHNSETTTFINTDTVTRVRSAQIE